MPRERVFVANDLRRFLAALDRHLTEPATIVVLGGSAIALYGVAAGTMDIDLWETDVRPLERALDAARDETGLSIPVQRAVVADVPHDAEDRLQEERSTWKRLTVLKLEPHDLALSKVIRGNEHDLNAIERLHAVIGLDRDTLLNRYVGEMDHGIGDARSRDQNFAALIERLYGETDAERVQEKLAAVRRGSKRTRT